MEATYYESKVKTVLDEQFPGWKVSVTSLSAADVKLFKGRMNQTKKELKQIKKEIIQELQAINAAYSNKRAHHKTYSLGHSIATTLKGSKSRSKGLASRNRELKKDQLKEQAPYEQMKQKIDEQILRIGQALLEIDEAWLKQKEKRTAEQTGRAERPAA